MVPGGPSHGAAGPQHEPRGSHSYLASEWLHGNQGSTHGILHYVAEIETNVFSYDLKPHPQNSDANAF